MNSLGKILRRIESDKPIKDRVYRVTPKTNGKLLSQSGEITPDTNVTVTTEPSETIVINPESEKAGEPDEAKNPYQKTIFAHPPKNPWRRLILWDIPKLLKREKKLTPEEIQYLEEVKRRELLENTLREEAELYKARIINTLDRLEKCYRYKKSERDFMFSGKQSVRFDYIVMQPDAHYFRVDIMHLPRGVAIRDLFDEMVLTDLSIACGRRVSGEYSEKSGAWFIVERATGVFGIPDHVRYQDMFNAFPASADGLSIPLGVTVNSKPVYRSLGTMYSMLIGGTIGSGKSNILNVILCTLIRRNSPERLKLLLVDLKGGLEFSFYEGIPHLLSVPNVVEGGIAYYRNQVPDLLKYLLDEGERRIAIMKNAGYKDIARYNQHHRKNYMPHMVLFIDEWGDVKLDPKIGRESEEILTNIAQRFRAVGIHVVLCTQMPKSEVVSTRVKAVLPAKLAFSTPTIEASKAIIDNGHAKGLNPPGRCILQWVDEIPIQTPYINEKIIHDVVQGAISGQYTEINQGHDVTPLEVQQWALEYDNGYLSIRKLYEQFAPRGITRAELMSWLQEWEDQTFVIGSSLYKVEPSAGTRARRLVAINEDEDDENNNVD